MANMEFKHVIENTGKWSKITIDSIDYVIKFEVKDGQDAWHSISCWLTDFTSMWTEVIEADTVIQRLKDSNKFLACNEIMTRILWTITAVPKVSNDLELTTLKEDQNDAIHLHAKYYLADGSDRIPLKFYWSLEKACTESFFEKFSKFMLLRIMDLEKANDFLKETICQRDEKLNQAQTNSEGDKGDGVDTDPGIYHEGLTCNNCKADIWGNRYKCAECEDFDLCMTCEQRRVHTQHIIVRYAQPDDIVRAERLFQKQAKPKNNKRTRFSR